MMKSVIVGVAAALMAAGAACSKTPDHAPAPQADGQAAGGGGMMRADTNGDGKISLDEWVKSRHAQFERIDANHDGKITADEIEAAQKAQEARMAERGGGQGGGRGGNMAERLKRADANGDGVITAEEYDGVMAMQFKRLDANGDGFITQDELAAMRERMGGGGGGQAQ